MRLTLAEKILSSRCVPELATHDAESPVRPGDLIEVAVDLVLANDITAPIAIREFGTLGIADVFDSEAIVLVADHFTPNKDIASAEQAAIMRRFAKQQSISHFYDVGRVGIEHVLLHELGLVIPGDVIVGADSHTCTAGAFGAFATGMGSTDIGVAMATGCVWMRVPETIQVDLLGELNPWVGGKDVILETIRRLGVGGATYAALEFGGSGVENLTLESRLTMSNMAIEAGAKVGLFAADDKVLAYLEGRTAREVCALAPDEGATYARTVNIDMAEIEPVVALPHLPENVIPVSEAGSLPIDQALIGSCTNGRIEDLRVAAEILRGRKIHPDVRCIIIPGSPQVQLAAAREGLIEVFLEAGAAVSTPTCGPCLGGHMGVLAAGERAVSTTNRNFRGRMGSLESEVVLSGPAVAAASAIAGRLAHPEEVLK
jgi:3-isopropylmalate/(R)-2-methylmalate dehydratase large subunit